MYKFDGESRWKKADIILLSKNCTCEFSTLIKTYTLKTKEEIVYFKRNRNCSCIKKKHIKVWAYRNRIDS